MTSAILPDLFVSRHQGAVEWARRQGLEVRLVSHLNPGDVRPGQRVIGTLPAHLAAEVCLAGGIYLHLCLDLPPLLRGQDLSADQMQACRARLLPIWAEIRDCGMAAGPAAAMPPENGCARAERVLGSLTPGIPQVFPAGLRFGVAGGRKEFSTNQRFLDRNCPRRERVRGNC